MRNMIEMTGHHDGKATFLLDIRTPEFARIYWKTAAGAIDAHGLMWSPVAWALAIREYVRLMIIA